MRPAQRIARWLRRLALPFRPTALSLAAIALTLNLAACVGASAGQPTPGASATPAQTTRGAPAAPGQTALTAPAPLATPGVPGRASSAGGASGAVPPAQTSDVEEAFMTNVDDLIAETADLVVTPCPELVADIQANPNLVPSIRGFASALKRIGASQPPLDTDAVRASLADLDHSMGEFEGALNQCGLR